MSDRYHALTVFLEEPLRDDDAELLIKAIRMLRGVMSVEPHITNVDAWARETAKQELRRQLWDVLK